MNHRIQPGKTSMVHLIRNLEIIIFRFHGKFRRSKSKSSSISDARFPPQRLQSNSFKMLDTSAILDRDLSPFLLLAFGKSKKTGGGGGTARGVPQPRGLCLNKKTPSQKKIDPNVFNTSHLLEEKPPQTKKNKHHPKCVWLP